VSAEVYDSIGNGYGVVRRPDPRIALQLRSAIGEARSVVNVGAGSGSYEPGDVATVALEPSAVMIAQRAAATAPVVQGRAEQLPFPDGSFDVALALLTVHHWADAAAGLSELRRVSRRQVILTWDPLFMAEQFWFARDYLPEASQRELELATFDPIVTMLGGTCAVEPVLVPADCTDGFYAAYWARPEAYLDPRKREGISALALTDQSLVNGAVDHLKSDLASGAWAERNSHLLGLDQFDAGYRVILAD
jgi:SAM-dependent methyltransferase